MIGIVLALIGPIFSIINGAATGITSITGLAGPIVAAIINLLVPVIQGIISLIGWYFYAAFMGLGVIFANISTLATISLFLLVMALYIHNVDTAMPVGPHHKVLHQSKKITFPDITTILTQLGILQ